MNTGQVYVAPIRHAIWLVYDMPLDLLFCRFYPSSASSASLALAIEIGLAVFSHVDHDGHSRAKVIAGVGDINPTTPLPNFDFILLCRTI
jgi:hypothetical protein